MKKFLGNIVTAYKKEKFSPFFNVVKTMKETITDIPTLIVGLENARENIDGFSILTKKYNDDLVWWTYKKTERKYEFDDDIASFYSFCTNYYLEKCEYYYINLPQYTYSKVKRFIKFVKSPVRKLCFQTRDSNFVFIYDTVSHYVFGLSITLLEYMGIPKAKVIKKIKSNKNNVFIYDTSFIDSNLRVSINNNTHYILPLAEVFYSV